MERYPVSGNVMVLPGGIRLQLSYRVGLFIVLLAAILTHLPSHFSQLGGDDFLIRANIAGDPQLYAAGFPEANPDKSFWQRMGDSFHFYSPDAGTLDFYQRYGNLTWWSSDDARMVPWRPVSAFTHWVDFQLAPDSFTFQAMHSLFYILLMAFNCYHLFWRIRPQAGLAVLASLLVTVDVSHLMNFGWIAARNVFIAIALACWSLERFLAWRQGERYALAISLLAFTTSLLAAENSLSILAYMGAYLLLVEKASLFRKGLWLAPYLAVVVVWRMIYNALGYGANGIGLYIDPGRDIMEFVAGLASTMPVILASMLTTVDSAITSLAPEVRSWYAVFSLLILLAGLGLILPLLRRNLMVRVMLLGCVLSAVPAAALLTGGPRSSIFASIGFFWILAVWLHETAVVTGRRWLRFLLMGAVTLHLALPALAGFLVTSELLPVTHVGNKRFASVENEFHRAGAGKAPELVMVNTPSPQKDYYMPFEWRFQHGVFPSGMNVLAPGFVSFELTRVSLREFELYAPMGLPLNHRQDMEDLNGHHPVMAPAFASQILQSLMTSPDDTWHQGTRRYAGSTRITVLALHEGRPSRLRIEFIGDKSPDQMVWQYFDWKEGEYRRMPVPAIGQTADFPGPFDVKAASAIKICLDCEEDAGEPAAKVQ